ncbi:MAG: hypothetical protein IAE80_28160, partial [Anaerolinea sp.]|nr:hypothetical protein [Anaerolinea sp.]
GQTNFTWSRVPGAAWYYVWVSLDYYGVGVDQWFEASAVCSADTCSANVPVQTLPGGYTWWVQAWSSPGGYGAWSEPARYTIPMSTPQPSAPSGVITDTQPIFSWQSIPYAGWYYLWVSADYGYVWSAWYEGTTYCAESMCGVTLPLTLTAGNYRFWVQAWNEAAGYSAWSAPLEFSVAPSDPILPNPTALIDPTLSPDVSLPEEPSSQGIP